MKDRKCVDYESQGAKQLPLYGGSFSKRLEFLLTDTPEIPFTPPGRLVRFSVVTALELCTRVSKGPDAGDKIRFFRKFLLMCCFTSDPLWSLFPSYQNTQHSEKAS